jgi:hypothetical protein
MSEYNSVKEFISDMLENEGSVFADNYGRRWKYEDYMFHFADLGDRDFTPEKIDCLHLFGSGISIVEGE